MHGLARRGTRVFTAQQLLDLPGQHHGAALDSWRSQPDVFPNVLTALVTVMSIALVTVLFMLGTTRAAGCAWSRTWPMRWPSARRWRTRWSPACARATCRAAPPTSTRRSARWWASAGRPAGHERRRRPTGRRSWPTNTASARRCGWPAGNAPPREGFESVFMRKDGTRFPVLIIEAPLINAHGLQTGWMSAVLDISEQRRVEELSRASQERLQATARLATVGEMASLLSHELNQPLAAIASYATGSHQPAARVAQRAARPTCRWRWAASRSRPSAPAGDQERARLRAAARPGARGGAAAGLIDAILPLVNLQARKLGVRVESRIADRLPLVLCDRTMVEQVLLNLARNAMQAMDEARVAPACSLLLQVRRAGASEIGKRWLEFSVADVGPASRRK
jgi:two-component system sensor histidine kinase DctS